jgi:hypothetical protein
VDRRWTVDRYLQEPHTEYVRSEDSIKICLLHARKQYQCLTRANVILQCLYGKYNRDTVSLHIRRRKGTGSYYKWRVPQQ